MSTARSAGRAAGLLLLAQGIGAALTNFVLPQPAFAAPGFLVNASPHALRLGASVLLGIVTGALALAIAITVLPILRKYSERMAFAFLALATAAMALAVVENGTVMSLLSLSKAYAASNGAEPALFEGLRGVVAASRNWAHFTHIVVGGATVFVFYAALYRFAMVPRALAGFGMAAFALQIATVSMPFFGIPVRFALLAPAGIANLALAAWLVGRGFSDKSPATP
jgi:hypothetical protein